MTPGRCPLCGAAHAACGQRTTGVGVVIATAPKEATVGELRPYTVTTPGGTTVLLLSDSDAKARGLAPLPADEDVVETKVREPANKARRAPNK